MTLLDAISIRTSQPIYLPEPLSPGHRQQLEKAISQVNGRTGLHIQLICGRPFRGFDALRGAWNYLVLAGPAGDPDLEEKCGYYGEELVLTAVSTGLGAYWVSETCGLCRVAEGDRPVCVAVLGYTPEKPAPRERTAGPAINDQRAQGPAWFAAGAAAAAPSWANGQRCQFELLPEGLARARPSGDFALTDLGIAKYDFAVGAHGGEWTWGVDGVFRKAAEEKSCGAVVWRMEDGQRRYLLACHNGGHWSFPKGHVEGAETEEETAAREIREETGLTAAIDTGFRQVVTYAPKPGVVKDVIFFTAVPTGGQEHPQQSEIASLGWFPFLEARERITYASDEEILLAAEAYLDEK